MSEVYDYRRLKGRIIEMYDTQANFAKAMGVRQETISNKLSGKRDFSRTEVLKIADLLKIPLTDLEPYFFCVLS